MKQHIKNSNGSFAGGYVTKLGLVAVLSMFALTNVQAADPYEISDQVSMISQSSERGKAKQELKLLEEEYINATIQALNKKQTGPDFSSEEVYVSHLVDVIEGKTQQGQPNFADEEVYVDHLVEIIMK